MACHSDTQDTLLGVSPQGPGGDMGTYGEAPSGCGGALPADYHEGWLHLSPGLWVTNTARLRSIIEMVARACFQRRREPMDAALWYVLARKTRQLSGLFKAKQDKKVADFL